MAEYIEREALMRQIKEIHCAECNSYHGVRCRACWVDDALGYIDSEPTADVVPVRHGKWLCIDTDTEQFFLCNRCKKKEYWESNYCPNCGCLMDRGDDE